MDVTFFGFIFPFCDGRPKSRGIRYIGKSCRRFCIVLHKVSNNLHRFIIYTAELAGSFFLYITAGMYLIGVIYLYKQIYQAFLTH